MVFNDARGSRKKAWLKFQNHEYVGGHFVLAANAKMLRGHKSEARIVLGMPENNNGAVPDLLALFESGADKLGAETSALMAWGDGHGGEAHNLQARMSR